jgi:hypothetical protein
MRDEQNGNHRVDIADRVAGRGVWDDDFCGGVRAGFKSLSLHSQPTNRTFSPSLAPSQVHFGAIPGRTLYMSWEPADPKNPSETALIGDEPFDLLGQAIRDVSSCYMKDLGRKPSCFELAKTLEQVLSTHFGEAVAEGIDHRFVSLSLKTRKGRPRQRCNVGDFLVAKAANGQLIYARLFEIHPGYGPLIGVYDSLGLERSELESLRSLPLIVKITPIHHELLEDYAWTAIGNLPINDVDRNQPRGPIQIAGVNEQLIAANIYYGLSTERRYNIEKFLNRKS